LQPIDNASATALKLLTFSFFDFFEPMIYEKKNNRMRRSKRGRDIEESDKGKRVRIKYEIVVVFC